MNRLPSTAIECQEEEEAGVSSPNSTVSSVSGKRSLREEDHDVENRGNISDEEDAETARKKLRLSKDQSAILEETFKEHNTLNPVINLSQYQLISLIILFFIFSLIRFFIFSCRSKSWHLQNNLVFVQDKSKSGSKTEELGLLFKILLLFLIIRN